ncbi:hypothetical protein [Conexibacter sp. CPCC 206217]|uniref:hypothetical protein n=1 Tax=Conexibacter sp. CPCC 206217 TaxID=3064574 RepID=UPI002717E2F4|nr:hypothetical protein [Conexibacter sp. CPCC 206217]MDO8209653.1 hypothetical protein [Conexibacter sp. CPCC 206217]
MLARTGGDTSAPTLDSIWPVIQQWAATPVADVSGHDSDLMLYETALSLKPASRHGSPPHFWIGITRQFAPDREEVEGICIALGYEHDEDPAATVTMSGPEHGYGAQTWGQAGTDEIPRWSRAVETERGFAVARHRIPRSMTIEYGGG